jgi:alpha-D-ribose 1-methylphosphonate 5-triphosphate diphosphatase
MSRARAGFRDRAVTRATCARVIHRPDLVTPETPMPLPLPPLRFVNAQVLRDGELQARSVAIEAGRITRGPLPEVDMAGYLILPGIVDLHGDAFERHLVPRPAAPFDHATALAAVEAEAAANGVTTAWLAQGWSWEGGHRGADAAEALLAALAAYRPGAVLDLRVQLCAEVHCTDSGDRLLAAVRRWGVDYVVFNDHLAEALEMRRSAPSEFAAWARRVGRSPEAHLAEVERAAAHAREVPRHLCRLAEAFDELGVAYGSHDDPDGETRERYKMIGARIAEFPQSRRAAAAARAMGDPVLMGAPNVVRGGSHKDSIAARALVAEGLCDALVSDYYYPALARAAFRLADEGILSFPRAWALISSAPAAILRLPDRGRIEPGRRADLIAVNAATRTVDLTIAGGALAFARGEAARRLAGAAARVRLAAA